ncbi:DUF3768 domain-containing protein [Sulfitobacter guttiformis]|uniref:Uncharacterized protein DUF3768 n=1 Tax=Sulfitobacter guttiformis TaxID=74349 RepID=A0A420DUP7_9RHOB|nr:DUF3768 domain-containing protein [Sulfitobacter guttiformis]RKE97888.1 uncharacterized protein DUF3768 [Sulfitobacter guttiformis]
MHDADAIEIAALNDQARRTFAGCRVMITQGVQALGEASVADVLQAVQNFDAFTADNDPYGEHDFGQITHQAHSVFWKFDYYDLDLTMHSPAPSDPAVTARVLTVMLADEY